MKEQVKFCASHRPLSEESAEKLTTWHLPTKLLAMLLLAALLLTQLCGCAGREAAEEEETFYLYYTNTDGTTLYQLAYAPDWLSNSSSKYRAEKVMESLVTAPEDLEGTPSDLTSLLAGDMFGKIELNSQDDKVTASVSLSEAYYDLTTAGQAMLRTGVSQSLFVSGGIDRVVLLAPSQTTVGQIDTVDSVEKSSRFSINQYGEGLYNDEVSVILYYLSEDGTALAKEIRTLELGMTESLSMAVVRTLIEGPQEKTHQSLIPSGTRVIDVVVEGDVCYVDLSAEFRKNFSGDEAREQLVIYSIVNSLCELRDVERVQFLIDGSRVSVYASAVRLDTALSADSSLVK